MREDFFGLGEGWRQEALRCSPFLSGQTARPDKPKDPGSDVSHESRVSASDLEKKTPQSIRRIGLNLV